MKDFLKALVILIILLTVFFLVFTYEVEVIELYWRLGC